MSSGLSRMLGARKKQRLSGMNNATGGKALPPGFEFVSSAHVTFPFETLSQQVFDSSTAANIPGIFFGRFEESIIPILSKVRTKVATWKNRQAVQHTEGRLLYDNCDENVGLDCIFDDKKVEKKEKMNDKEKLEVALLAMITTREFDTTGRDFYPGILESQHERGDPECPPDPQDPHTDWKDPREFYLIPKKDWPLACLFPATEQGCWLQVWPPNGGRGIIIRLERGEVLFMHPQTVHGGCLGIGCPRVQAYITKDPSEAEHYTQYVNPASGVEYSKFYTQAIRRVGVDD